MNARAEAEVIDGLPVECGGTVMAVAGVAEALDALCLTGRMPRRTKRVRCEPAFSTT